MAQLLLAWMSIEAVKTQSPVLVFWNSLAEFMRKQAEQYAQEQKAHIEVARQWTWTWSITTRVATMTTIYDPAHPGESTKSSTGKTPRTYHPATVDTRYDDRYS